MVREARIPQLLTMERQFCTRCWSQGKRTRVISWAERADMTERRYRAMRRRLTAEHYTTAHPEVQ